MKKALTLIYVLTTIPYSIFAVIAELQPAVFWMDIFAPSIGDTYPIVIVGGLTMLTFLLPMVFILLAIRWIQNKYEKPQMVDGPGIWIIRKRQLQSALIELPVYVNDKKIGAIDMGKIRFFEAPTGKNTVNIGKGMVASEKLEFTCSATEQPYFNLEIVQSGLIAKYVLTPIASREGGLR